MPWVKKDIPLVGRGRKRILPYPNNDDVGIVDVGDADRGPGGHIVVEVDTFFEKEGNKKEIPADQYTCSAQNVHNNPESFKL
jgi:hypothetical protein